MLARGLCHLLVCLSLAQASAVSVRHVGAVVERLRGCDMMTCAMLSLVNETG